MPVLLTSNVALGLVTPIPTLPKNTDLAIELLGSPNLTCYLYVPCPLWYMLNALFVLLHSILLSWSVAVALAPKYIVEVYVLDVDVPKDMKGFLESIYDDPPAKYPFIKIPSDPEDVPKATSNF